MAIHLVPRSVEAGDWREIVSKQVGSIDYGSVEIVIHDSRIVHIDTTKRLRLESHRPDQRAAIARADQRAQFRRGNPVPGAPIPSQPPA